MTTTVISRAGETVDLIVWRQYGRPAAGAVEAVLLANPGLAERGPVLPAGLAIALPDLPAPALPVRRILLWD